MQNLLLILVTIVISLFVSDTFGQGTRSIDQISYSFERDQDQREYVQVKVTLRTDDSGNIPDGTDPNVIILCARKDSSEKHKPVRAAESSQSLTYNILVGGPPSSEFRLRSDWTSFLFKLGTIQSNIDPCSQRGQLAGFDIQIAKNPPIPKTTFSQTKNIFAVGDPDQNGNVAPELVMLEITPSRCEEFKVELKLENSTFARSETIKACNSPTIVHLNAVGSLRAGERYWIYVNDEKLPEQRQLQVTPPYHLANVELIDTNGNTSLGNLINESRVNISNVATRKILRVSTRNRGRLKLTASDPCVIPESQNSPSLSEVADFNLEFRESCNGKTIAFAVTGTAVDVIPLSGANAKKPLLVYVDTTIRIVSPLSFESKDQKTILTFKLNRKNMTPAPKLEVKANGQSLSLNETAKYDAQNDLYSVELPSNLIELIQRRVAGTITVPTPTNPNANSVPVTFSIVDSQNKPVEGASLELRAFGFNTNLVREITALEKISDKAQAEKKAKDLLGLAGVASPSEDEKAAIDQVTNMLRAERTSRGKWMKIFSFAGRVAAGYFGIPLPI